MNTTMATASAEERLRRYESGYERASNKADLFQLENRIISRMKQLESRLIQWMRSLMVGIAVVALAEFGFLFRCF